ncbi:MAG: rhodanese-like domain-containing protein [Wolinella sp.]
MIGRILFLLLFFASLAVAERVDIDNNELEALQKDGARVLDIRMESEWKQTGVIPGSELLSYFDAQRGYDTLNFVKALKSRGINFDTPIVIVCRTGNRTKLAAEHLIDAGFLKVYNLKYGITGWKHEGRLVEYIGE